MTDLTAITVPMDWADGVPNPAFHNAAGILPFLADSLATLTPNRRSVHSTCQRGNGSRGLLAGFSSGTAEEGRPARGTPFAWEVRALHALRSHCSLRPLPPFPASPLRGNLSPAGPSPCPRPGVDKPPGRVFLPPQYRCRCLILWFQCGSALFAVAGGNTKRCRWKGSWPGQNDRGAYVVNN